MRSFCAVSTWTSWARFPTRPRLARFSTITSAGKRSRARRSFAGRSAIRAAHGHHVRRDADGAAPPALAAAAANGPSPTRTGASICDRALPTTSRSINWPARSWPPTASIPRLRPAVKFYLDRDGDPDLLARDVGRLFFGRDLQCAQCHDHPLVDDYLQADYYGLKAFVNRGVLFDDAKEKKVYYAERRRRRSDFQVGIHRRRPRARAARSCRKRRPSQSRCSPRTRPTSSRRPSTCVRFPSTAAALNWPAAGHRRLATPPSIATWPIACGRR